jgi:peptide/nickel transport system substrate-binding protein
MLLLICAFFVLISLSGCSNEDITEPHVPSELPHVEPIVEDNRQLVPLYGGTLKLSMRRPLTLNPILNEDITVDSVLRLVFEPLAALNESQRPVPNLAEDINFSSDGLSVIITLRDGLLWSNGEPVTAHDIIFTLDLIKSASEHSIYKKNIMNMQSYEVINNMSARINYYEAFHEAYYMLMFPIVPTNYYRNETNLGSGRNMNPVGNGMYKFVNYENMRQLFFERNDLYYKSSPYVDNVEVVILPDYQSDLFAFEQGVIDALVVDFDIWNDYGAGKEMGMHEFDAPLFDFIGFNFSRSEMSNHNVRKAVAHAVNLQAIAVNVYHSHAETTKTIMHPNSWLYEENVAEYPFDLDVARGFLDLSGVSFNPNEPLIIIVNSENEERVRVAEMLSDALNEIGIYNITESFLFFEYSDRLSRNEYDIVVGGFYLDTFPDFTFMLHSASENIFNYRSDYMDSLLMIAKMSGTETTFRRAMGDIQKEVCEDLPMIGIAYRNRMLLTDNRIYGEKRPVINNSLNNINEWFIEYMLR